MRALTHARPHRTAAGVVRVHTGLASTDRTGERNGRPDGGPHAGRMPKPIQSNLLQVIAPRARGGKADHSRNRSRTDVRVAAPDRPPAQPRPPPESNRQLPTVGAGWASTARQANPFGNRRNRDAEHFVAAVPCATRQRETMAAITRCG